MKLEKFIKFCDFNFSGKEFVVMENIIATGKGRYLQLAKRYKKSCRCEVFHQKN
eukprot:TRINITY_DN3326_c4_g4_i1.p4 TRINITY_DN3326_c4_g4~~TRINITY_DN3326_c4_g4_i1.p4  ORF type:complete len:54 (-),score=12.35 TRINITY_DN3326_c4_g4_i1:464-625(-)